MGPTLSSAEVPAACHDLLKKKQQQKVQLTTFHPRVQYRLVPEDTGGPHRNDRDTLSQ